jgi:hypothetical protein
MNRRLAAMLLGAAALLAVPAVAAADPVMDMAACGTCYPQDAAHLRVDPVLLDPALTSVTPGQAEQLANQIRHTGKPVFVLFLAGPKGGVSKAGPYMDGVASALNLTADESAVIAVATPKGFYATGYHVSDSDQSAIRDAATKAAKSSASPYQAVSTWLPKVLPLDLTPPPAPEPVHWGPVLAVIGIILAAIVLVACGVIWWLWMLSTRRRRDEEAAETRRQRDDLEAQIDRLRDDLMALEGVPAAADAQRRGLLDLDTAITQMDDLDSAQRFYKSAKERYAEAEDAAHPERVAAREAAAQAERDQRERLKSYNVHKVQQGRKAVKVYESTQQTPECPHYWGGGRGYPSGYYSRQWWDWAPVVAVVETPSYIYPTEPGGRATEPYGSYGSPDSAGSYGSDYGGGSYGSDSGGSYGSGYGSGSDGSM